MPAKIGKIYLLILAVCILSALATAGLLHAQPGTEADPVVSLSYLDTALSFTPVTLEGGEEFSVNAGRGIILLDGSCRLSFPEDTSGGRFWVIDITDGTVNYVDFDMVGGHLYIPVSEVGTGPIFTVQAWQNSTVAIPGGTGR